MNVKWHTSILLAVAMLFGMSGVVHAKGGHLAKGRLVEKSDQPALITVGLTDKDKNNITPVKGDPKNPNYVNGWPMMKKTTQKPNGKNVAVFTIPSTVRVHDDPVEIPVTDVDQTTTLLGHSGEVADLSVEAVVLNPDTGKFEVENIFGALAGKVGLYHPVSVPDLFADTNNDGILGEGDVLYSLVDLNVYLDSVPSFSLGDTFTITDGLVSGLPGMMFATTPFGFDPDTGLFAPSDPASFFSGSGTAFSRHDLTAVVPEPSSLIMMGSGLLLLGSGCYARRRVRRPKSTSTIVSA